jgi:hypothetical protein
MRGRVSLAASAMLVVACGSALDQADKGWTTATSNLQVCNDDPSIAATFPAPSSYVAESKCETVFLSALQAISWPDSVAADVTALENDVATEAGIEAMGQVPSVSQSQHYIADRQQLDDDLARQRLSQT